jgi:seryl-tRNA synthetase
MDISYLFSNKEQYVSSLKARFMNVDLIDKIEVLHKDYVSNLFNLQQTNRLKNLLTKLVPGKYILTDHDKEFLNEQSIIIGANRTYYIDISRDINKKLILLQETVDKLYTERNILVSKIPNLIGDKTPIDDNEDRNPIISTYGDPFKVDGLLDHYELCNKFKLLESATDFSGHRGYVMVGDLVRLNYAIMNYSLDFIQNKKFKVMYVPHFLKKEWIENVCQLSEFDETLYKLDDTDEKYLIATSEQFLTAYHTNKKILDLPQLICGVSTCFRKEAGAHGKDVSGIFRVHQFEKVEMFTVTDNDKSWEMMENMINIAKEFYESLGLPYRVVNIVSGALNNAAAMKYDIEGWFPGSGKYRELVSCSNTLDYFSRKIKTVNNKGEYVHMLNSTLYANTRTLCCILENYQEINENKIKIPHVLIPYFGKSEIVLLQ